MGPTLFIFVNDPKLIEQVLSSPKCLEKSFLYKFLRLDKGLLVAKSKLIPLAQQVSKFVEIPAEHWLVHRKNLDFSFQQNIIKSFVRVFIESADLMVESVGKFEDKESIDIFKITSRCSLTMVLATSFGMTAKEVTFDDDLLKAVEE